MRTFHLRTMFIATLVIGSALAVFLMMTNDARRREAIRRHLESFGITYVGFNENDDVDWISIDSFQGKWEPEQFSEFDTISNVDLSGTIVSDSELRFLQALPPFQYLSLTDTQITDEGLKHLERLSHLESLSLCGTHVTDDGVESLIAIPGLKAVSLQNTNVSPRGVELLKKAIPNIGIHYGTLTEGDTD